MYSCWVASDVLPKFNALLRTGPSIVCFSRNVWFGYCWTREADKSNWKCFPLLNVNNKSMFLKTSRFSTFSTSQCIDFAPIDNVPNCQVLLLIVSMLMCHDHIFSRIICVLCLYSLAYLIKYYFSWFIPTVL